MFKRRALRAAFSLAPTLSCGIAGAGEASEEADSAEFIVEGFIFNLFSHESISGSHP